MLEPALADVRDGSSGGFAEFPANCLRDELGANLLGVPFRAPDRPGQVALLAGPGVSTQVDVDSPGVPAPHDVAMHTRHGTPDPLPSPLPSEGPRPPAPPCSALTWPFTVGATGFEPVTSAV